VIETTRRVAARRVLREADVVGRDVKDMWLLSVGPDGAGGRIRAGRVGATRHLTLCFITASG
jgi:hypothetical protein